MIGSLSRGIGSSVTKETTAMPFAARCPDHPGTVMENVQDELRHIDADHGGDLKVRDRFPTGFVPQVVAQGNRARFVFACRACGRTVNTDDPTRATTGRCTPCGVAS